MLRDKKFWRIETENGDIRRFLLPIYGTDQLMFVAALAALLALGWGYIGDSKLIAYVGVGAYAGFVISMIRSTPSRMTVPERLEPQIIQLLDESPALLRIQPDVWIRNVSRVKRWASDTLRIRRCGNCLLITGRHVDLEQIRAATAMVHGLEGD